MPWFGRLRSLPEFGWFGVGLGEGRLKWGGLPNGHNDFIFALIAEELGVAPGSTMDEPGNAVNEAPKSSLPVNRWSTSAATALKVLCPDI